MRLFDSPEHARLAALALEQSYGASLAVRAAVDALRALAAKLELEQDPDIGPIDLRAHVREITAKALMEHGGNIAAAGRHLGLNRTTMAERVKKDPYLQEVVDRVRRRSA